MCRSAGGFFQNGKVEVKEKDVIKLRPLIRLVHHDTILYPFVSMHPCRATGQIYNYFNTKQKITKLFFTKLLQHFRTLYPQRPILYIHMHTF
jgi:hypothetical protein